MEISLRARLGIRLVSLLWVPVLAQEVIFKEIPPAFDAAKRSQKPLFIYFSAVWCGPCRWVEKKILPNDQFVALTDSFVRLKVMAASGEHSTPGGDSLAKLYKVSAYPTFVLAEPDGKPYYTWVGLRGNDESEALDNLKWHLARAALYRIGEKPPDSLAVEPDAKPFPAASALEHLKTVVHRADTASFPQALGEYLQFFQDWCAAWSIPGAQDVIKSLPMKGDYFRRWVWQHLDTLAQSLPEYSWEALREALIWTAYDSLCEKVGFPQCTTLIWAHGSVYAALLPSAPLLAKKYIAYRLLDQQDLKARLAGALLLIEFAEATYPPRTFIAEEDSIEAFIGYLGLMEIADALIEACPDTALLRIPVRWLESATQLAPQLPLFWQTLAQMLFYLHDKESARVACQRARQTNQEHVGVVYGFFSFFSFYLGEEFEREIQRLCQRIESLPDANHPTRRK